MPVIKRNLPRTNTSRQAALMSAVRAQNNLPPGTTVLNDATKTRLLAMEPQYIAALALRGTTKAAVAVNTRQQKPAIARLKLLVNHFIQVFNLGAGRGEYPAADRAFYGLPESRSRVPAMNGYFEIITWAERIVSGDAERVAAGGAPMANPSAAQVQAQHLAAMALFNNQSTLKDAKHKAQKDLRKLNAKADLLIKRVWNEVETYYGEKPAEGKRNSARKWGVQYVSVEKTKPKKSN